MPNPIKYTTGTETLALKKGDFYIGTGDVGKGPSDTTGYYQGPNVPSGGYVIYLNKEGAPGGLSYHNAPTDNDLITFTNNLAGQSYTTVQECLMYYAGQSDKVVLNRDYEGIVTKDLLCLVDASSTISYPHSGNTWYDISPNGNNISLVNGPSFNYDVSNSSIEFDGTNDYYTMSSNPYFTLLGSGGTSLTYSVSAWCKIPTNSGQQKLVQGYASGYSLSSMPLAGGCYILYNSTQALLYVADFGWFTGSGGYYRYSSNANLIKTNSWINIIFNFNHQTSVMDIWLNGSKYNGSGPINGVPPSILDSPIRSGVLYGSYGMIMFYGRNLTDSEILQNYNAQKSRFGL
jgi:hypothetical protein